MSEDKLLWFAVAEFLEPIIDRYLGLSHSSTPFFTVYDYDNPLVPVKLADPATLPPGTCEAITFRNGSNVIAVGTNAAPFLMFYEIIAGVLTKLSDPATLPTTTVLSVRFSNDGRYLAVGATAATSTQTLFFYDMQSGSPVLVSGTPAFLPSIDNASWDPLSNRCMINEFIYDLTSGTATLTFTLLSLGYTGSGWSVDGRYLGAMNTATPFVHFWDWNSGSPVLLADPVTIANSTGRDLAWDIDNNRIVTTVHGHTGASPGNDSTRYDLTTGVAVSIADLNPEPSVSGGGSPSEVWYRNDNSFLAVSSQQSTNLFVYDNTVSPPVGVTPPVSSGTGATGVAWGGF